MWHVKASAQLSVAPDIAPWKYTAPSSAATMARSRRSMIAIVMVNANLTIRKAAMETVTLVVGITLPGQRYSCRDEFSAKMRPCCSFGLLMLKYLFMQCSKSCGGGTRRRGAVCRKAAEGSADENKCSQRDKLTVQSCNDFLCPQWKTGDWSEVSYCFFFALICLTVLWHGGFKNRYSAMKMTKVMHLQWQCGCFESFVAMKGVCASVRKI